MPSKQQRRSSTAGKRGTRIAFSTVLLVCALVVAINQAAHSAPHDMLQPVAQQLQNLPAASHSELPELPKPAQPDALLEASDLSLEEARCYLQRYPDLQKLFGESVDKAKRHWKEKGRLEQRVVKCPFLPAAYNSSFIKSRCAVRATHACRMHEARVCQR